MGAILGWMDYLAGKKGPSDKTFGARNMLLPRRRPFA